VLKWKTGDSMLQEVENINSLTLGFDFGEFGLKKQKEWGVSLADRQ